MKRTRVGWAALLCVWGLIACGGSATTNTPSSSSGGPGTEVGGGTNDPYADVGGYSNQNVAGYSNQNVAGYSNQNVAGYSNQNVAGYPNQNVGGYSNVTGADGLRANYHFDEVSGAYAIDSLSQARGVIYLASRVDGVRGKALGFSAPGARVELSALGDFSAGEMSIELWLRPASLAGGAVAHLVGDGGGGVQSFRLELQGGKVALLVAPQSGGTPVLIATSQGALDVGRWQLVTVTFDGSTVHIYFDGSEDTAVPIIAPLATSGNTIYVGALPSSAGTGYTDQLDGDVDELKIWNVALSATDAASHFSEAKP